MVCIMVYFVSPQGDNKEKTCSDTDTTTIPHQQICNTVKYECAMDGVCVINVDCETSINCPLCNQNKVI